MSDVTLFIEAKTTHLGTEMVNAVKTATCNSISEIVSSNLLGDNALQVLIHTSSDKLESLVFKFANADLHLAENTIEILANAATQYSVHRNIFLNLSIQGY